MNTRHAFLALCTLPCLAMAANTGSAFYGDGPDEHHPWAVHDRNRPQPVRVEPGTPSTQEQPGKPPSDAIVLFGGAASDLDKWEADKKPAEPTKWEVKDGVLQCVPKSGYIRTKEEFADCQLHVEWSEPSDIEGESQGRGNSGVFLMGYLEVQVLDNYNNPTYADGFAASLYGVNPPMANPLRKPGEWQVYDIVFRKPVYKDGKQLDAGYVTVFSNGVLVQDHTPLEGPGGHHNRSKTGPFPEKGPLKLQDHGNPVKYRNIWYRPLPKRTIEGATEGFLTEEATKAKRAEIAKTVRDDAAKLQGNAKTLRLLESLCYANDEAALKEATASVDAFVKTVQALPADKVESKKNDIMSYHTALQYLTHFKNIPEDFGATKDLAAIVKAHGWDKKK
ncbi:MAG: hypothetical protein JWO08_323 [Verrucomicrobiaceae bacterium]|nr:hypothetical protein [Verrucomicrobiaceae bacterium]